jgi:hypothetical protein
MRSLSSTPDGPPTRSARDLPQQSNTAPGRPAKRLTLRQHTSSTPRRIAVDVAVMLADGGEAIADLAVLPDQSALFGPVASDPTASRLLAHLDASMLAELRAA